MNNHNFAIDLSTPLPQVLADGETTSIYDLTRLAQEGAAGREYSLTDALCSVRLLAGKF